MVGGIQREDTWAFDMGFADLSMFGAYIEQSIVHRGNRI